jgi:putative SOS response-associated peptidase YedK
VPSMRHAVVSEMFSIYRRAYGLCFKPMCGRYVRRSDKQKIAEHFQVHGPSLPDFGPSWNVAPQTFQPVIRLNRDTGEREIVLMRWGLIPYWILLANSGGATEVVFQTVS